MIENVIILLVANTLLPYVPLHSAFLLPLPLAQLPLEAPSALYNMNLSRLHTPEEFKRTFRESLKVHHPDHGGKQEIFQQIQGLKKIMQQPVNYYDLYNVTDADLSGNMPLAETVETKSLTFYVQLGIFYFICALYVLAFTLDSDSQLPRRVMLALIVAFLAYEYFIHENPTTPTVIDLIDPHIPLFVQSKLIKRSLAIFLAIIRSFFIRRKSEQKTLIAALQKGGMSPEQQQSSLQRLTMIYHGRAVQKEAYEKSIWAKLRNWISKLVSGFFLLMMAKNILGL